MSTNQFSEEKIVEIFGGLLGIIDGILADGTINSKEVSGLKDWMKQNKVLETREPFTGVFKSFHAMLSDNTVEIGELDDIRYLCDKCIATFGPNTAIKDHKLVGVINGVAIDGDLNMLEWTYLRTWVDTNSGLAGTWPYDEVKVLLKKHKNLKGRITDGESKMLLRYFREFCGPMRKLVSSQKTHPDAKVVSDIYTLNPVIEFHNKVFCITGDSKVFERSRFEQLIIQKGGEFKKGMSSLVDYLVVCTEGSPAWIASSYGLKIKRAVELQCSGHHILIVKEEDFVRCLPKAS